MNLRSIVAVLGVVWRRGSLPAEPFRAWPPVATAQPAADVPPTA